MLLKLLFLAVVLFYVVKTFRTLVRVISQDGNPSRLNDDRGGPAGWARNGSKQRDHYDDVEDAKYVDI